MCRVRTSRRCVGVGAGQRRHMMKPSLIGMRAEMVFHEINCRKDLIEIRMGFTMNLKGYDTDLDVTPRFTPTHLKDQLDFSDLSLRVINAFHQTAPKTPRYGHSFLIKSLSRTSALSLSLSLSDPQYKKPEESTVSRVLQIAYRHTIT